MRTRFLLATFFAALSAAFVFPVAHVAGIRLGGKGGTIVWDGSGDVATMNTLLPKEEALENVTSGVVGVPTNLVIRLIMRVGIKQVPPTAPDSSDDGDGFLGLETLKLLLTARLPCDSCLPLCPAIPDLAKVNFDTCDNGPDPTNLVASADVEGLIAGPVYADGAEFTLTPSAFDGLKNAIRNKGLLAGLRLGLSIVTSDDYRENGKVDEYATFQLIPLTAGDAQSAPTAGVLLQNDNGQLSDWLLSANQFIDHATLRNVPPSWKLVGSGDVDRDGDADLFWHEQNEGWVAVWRMDGTRMLSGDYLTPSRVPDTNWKLRTIGDLDGNGYPDLVWQNVLDERVIIWFMNGTTLLRDMPMQPAMLDRNWHFVAAGDTNGDGRADLFLQHQLSGKVGLWIMNGRVNVSGGFLTPDQVPIQWKIRGAKDLNGDGRPDLLLQNATTGALARWLMNGSSRVEEILLTPAEVGHPKWRLAAVR